MKDKQLQDLINKKNRQLDWMFLKFVVAILIVIVLSITFGTRYN